MENSGKLWKTLENLDSRAGPLVAAVFTAASPSRACDYELRVMALYGGGGGGEALRSFRVPCMQLANTRLDLICVDHEWDGVTVVDPASGRMLAAGAEPRPAVVSVVTEVSDISFGRAAASGDYKLVRIRQSVPPWPDGGARHREKVCEVATVRMAVGGGAPPPPVTWRRRPAPPFLTTFESRRKASINGLLYFLHREELAGHELVDLGDQRRVPSRDLIAVFDLESETWKKAIVRPPREEVVVHVRLVRDNVTLGELKGALIMVHRSTGVFADLMEMPEGFRSSMAVYTGSLLSSA